MVISGDQLRGGLELKDLGVIISVRLWCEVMCNDIVIVIVIIEHR